MTPDYGILNWRVLFRKGQYRQTSLCVWVTVVAFAVCGSTAIASPRTWADQDSSAPRQPGWLPFPLAQHAPNPAVARITVVESNARTQGSGTLVEVRGKRGLIVTNWHVVRDAQGPIVVTFPDGFRSAATLLKVDRKWDLAALLIWRPRAMPISISASAPIPGDVLTIAGYGSGDYRAVKGRCTQYVAPGRHMPYEMVEVSAEARQGDSGGPILNERGELAGVLFGAGGGTTSGSFCGRVRWFVESAWPSEQASKTEVFISLPTHQSIKEWPPDGLIEIPQKSTPNIPRKQESAPNYTVGSTLTHSAHPAQDRSDSQPNASLAPIAGATPFEQAKSLLAAIGIVAILLQLSRSFGGGRVTR